jgi:hypothetical protein
MTKNKPIQILRDECERLAREVERLMVENGLLKVGAERLTAVVQAIDESEPGKASSWRYRREELVKMARKAIPKGSVRRSHPWSWSPGPTKWSANDPEVPGK